MLINKRLERIKSDSDAYAARVGGDERVATAHECGMLRGELSAALAELDRLTGVNDTPQPGCAITSVEMGDARVLVEYEYTAGERAVHEGPLAGPGYQPSVVIIRAALVNGEWVNAEDYFAPSLIESWEQAVIDGELA